MNLRRFRSNRADSILVTAIFSIVLVFLISLLTLDVVKNTYLKQGYTSMAQDAVENSMRTINSRGSLNESTPQAVVNAYMDRRKKFEGNVYNSEACSTIERTYTESGLAYNTIKTEQKKVPFMLITLSSGRSSDNPNGKSVIFESEGGGPVRNVSGVSLDPKVKYTVVSAQIYDSTENFMVNIASLASDDYNFQCQYFNNDVSAVSYGSNSDL